MQYPTSTFLRAYWIRKHVRGALGWNCHLQTCTGCLAGIQQQGTGDGHVEHTTFLCKGPKFHSNIWLVVCLRWS